MCASIPGQQGGACAQHCHLGRGSGWLTFHLGSRRLGGLAESLLKTVGGEGRRGGNEKWWRPGVGVGTAYIYTHTTSSQRRGDETGNFTVEGFQVKSCTCWLR